MDKDGILGSNKGIQYKSRLTPVDCVSMLQYTALFHKLGFSTFEAHTDHFLIQIGILMVKI